MGVRVYNTLTRRLEPFEPLEPPQVKFYCCGPTVYDFIGIHNARTFVNFDIIRRYLEFRGYRVIYVQNITDIDDKIIQRAQEQGVDPLEWAERYTRYFQEDMAALGVRPPDKAPRATEALEEIRSLIERLLQRRAAYQTPSGVYFRVEAFPEYGKLSHRTPEDIRAGARIEVDEEKEDPRDFALWKRAKIGEPWWESPWGPGRPGWHIECSAMVIQHLGESIDIHAGGADLIFPHHENEIAQSETATGKPFVKYWLHGGLMRVGGERMGKSLGNFIRVRDALKQYPRDALRLFLISAHYRKPLDFTEEAVRDQIPPARRLNRCWDALERLASDASPLPEEPGRHPLVEAVVQARHRFIEAVDDDFNIPGGLGVIFELVTEINRFLGERQPPTEEDRRAMGTALAFLNEVAEGVLGLRLPVIGPSDEQVQRLLDAALQLREEARQERDWEIADRIRDHLKALGVVVQDTPEGPQTEWEGPPESESLGEAIVKLLVELRAQARAARNWTRADHIREALARCGVQLHDTPEGTTWEWR